MSKTQPFENKVFVMGKKSKVPLSVRNGSKELRIVVILMLLSIMSTLYHVWAYETELGLRYGVLVLFYVRIIGEGEKNEQGTPP